MQCELRRERGDGTGLRALSPSPVVAVFVVFVVLVILVVLFEILEGGEWIPFEFLFLHIKLILR